MSIGVTEKDIIKYLDIDVYSDILLLLNLGLIKKIHNHTLGDLYSITEATRDIS